VIDPSRRTSYSQLEVLSLSLLKACGLTDTGDIVSVAYRHHVGEMPRLDGEYLVKPDWDTYVLEGMELRTTTVTFVPQGVSP
jgi:hypothetical protein